MDHIRAGYREKDRKYTRFPLSSVALLSLMQYIAADSTRYISRTSAVNASRNKAHHTSLCHSKGHASNSHGFGFCGWLKSSHSYLCDMKEGVVFIVLRVFGALTTSDVLPFVCVHVRTNESCGQRVPAVAVSGKTVSQRPHPASSILIRTPQFKQKQSVCSMWYTWS